MAIVKRAGNIRIRELITYHTPEGDYTYRVDDVHKTIVETRVMAAPFWTVIGKLRVIRKNELYRDEKDALVWAIVPEWEQPTE